MSNPTVIGAEKRRLAMKWWRALSVTAQDNYSFKFYGREWETLTGCEIERMHKDAIRVECQAFSINASAEYCPDCASDLEYQHDVDDYDAWYDKCPVCGWDNAQVNADL